MNKYIIDGNIDFYEELLKEDDNINNVCYDNINNVCLLTGLPLVKNHIRLSCSHVFNYEALFNEVKSQKQYNEYDIQYLGTSDIKCPYCRNISHNLLPYVPCIKKERINGVNAPEKYTMNHKFCSYLFMRGKNRGVACNQNGFETDYGDLCETHWKKCIAKKADAPTIKGVLKVRRKTKTESTDTNCVL